jgi:hypothetical protein
MLLGINRSPDPFQKNLKTFVRHEVITTADICRTILHYPWTPGIFIDNHRATKNFIHADVLGLDFDGKGDASIKISDIERWLIDQNFRYIIGLTKSHRDEAHCFRVIIPWAERICDGYQYNKNVEALTTLLPVDEGSWQCARFFSPCKSIYKISTAGLPAVWFTHPLPVKRQQKFDVAAKMIPAWIQKFLDFGTPSHQRNNTCFRIAGTLARRGFSDDEIVSMFLRSKIGLDEEEFGLVTESAAAGRRKCNSVSIEEEGHSRASQ